jgi:hypothetical protein
MLPPLKDETAHATISGALNAVMALVVRSITIRLVRHDMFNGVRILDELDVGVHKQVEHKLRPFEQEPQDVVEAQWDREDDGTKKKQASGDGDGGSDVDPNELLKYILFAKLAAVHLACEDAGYGEIGSRDREIQEADANVDVLELLGIPVPDISVAAKATMHTKRKALRATVSDSKWSSSRTDSTVNIIQDHLRKRPGKMVVFSEFLCTLNVLDVALQECGFKDVPRFDGTVTDEEDRDLLQLPNILHPIDEYHWTCPLLVDGVRISEGFLKGAVPPTMVFSDDGVTYLHISATGCRDIPSLSSTTALIEGWRPYLSHRDDRPDYMQHGHQGKY